MALRRITQLPLDTSVTGPDVVPIVSDGATKRVTLTTLSAFFSAAGATGPTGAASTVAGPTGAQGATGPAGTTTWAGITDKPATFPPSAHTHVHSEVSNAPATLSQFTANQNNLALGSGGIVRISSDAARTITGFVATTDGDARLLVNVGAYAITLKHQDAASSEANRILGEQSQDVVVQPETTAVLIYDATSSRWRASGGETLVVGPTGPAGVSVTGPTGAAGEAGSVGATGPTGASIVGPTGAAGAAGAAGATGPTGASGAAGSQGVAGATGATGPTGAASSVAGPAGPTGATGPAGTTTWSGITGTPTTLAGYGITDAASLSHAHSALDITSGTIATARLGSGTASASTFLRGDQTYADPITYATTAQAQAGTSTATVANPQNVRDSLLSWWALATLSTNTVANGATITATGGTPPVYLAFATTTTTSGTAVATVGTPGNAFLAHGLYSGMATSAKNWAISQSIFIRLVRHTSAANSILRVQLGEKASATGFAQMNGRGIGVEIRNARLWILAHDGTTLTQHDTGIDTNGGQGNSAVAFDLLLTSSGGTVSVAYSNAGTTTTASTTGGPTTLGSNSSFVTVELTNGASATACTYLVVPPRITYQ